MAAIPNLVTGGIGPASEIKYLLTGGLDIGAAISGTPRTPKTFTVPARRLTFTVPAQ